jgi:hypothetical protein
VLYGIAILTNPVGHVWREREACFTLIVASWEGDSLRSCRTGTSNVQVEAVLIDLDLSFQVVCLELPHISMQSNKLDTQNIGAGLDITW